MVTYAFPSFGIQLKAAPLKWIPTGKAVFGGKGTFADDSRCGHDSTFAFETIGCHFGMANEVNTVAVKK